MQKQAPSVLCLVSYGALLMTRASRDELQFDGKRESGDDAVRITPRNLALFGETREFKQ